MHNPIARRVRRDVEVQDSPPTVRDDQKAVDDLTVVVEEGQPLRGLALVRMTLQLLKIARHGGFGNRESELEQFAVDARRTPMSDSLP
jgi:hypothetical protein